MIERRRHPFITVRALVRTFHEFAKVFEATTADQVKVVFRIGTFQGIVHDDHRRLEQNAETNSFCDHGAKAIACHLRAEIRATNTDIDNRRIGFAVSPNQRPSRSITKSYASAPLSCAVGGDISRH